MNTKKLFQKIKSKVLWPYKAFKRHMAFRKRVKELKKKDPFNYK